MQENDEYIHKDLCYAINGCAFEAFKCVGIGYEEINYHKVFHDLLIKNGFNALYKSTICQKYKGEIINTFEIDEIVENQIIIEVKCIQSGFLPENFAQIITYLKLLRYRLGLMINFGLHKAFTKRVIFDEHRIDDSEYWDDNFIESIPDHGVVNRILDSIKSIHNGLGPGYLCFTYKKAFLIEAGINNLSLDNNVSIDLFINNIRFNPVEIDFWIVENMLLLGILTGTKSPRLYDILRMRSYLKRLNLHHGLICYWSTNNLQIYGLWEP